MTSITEIIKQKREQAFKSTPQKPKDYILQTVLNYLDKLDSNVETVISKNPINLDVSKSGKSTRFELRGKPIEIEAEGELNRIPVSLVVYEDKQGIKEAWYAATDAKRNRVITRYIVVDHEVQMT